MLIRAIDPGPTKSAFVDWDGKEIRNFGIFENRHHHNSMDEIGPIQEVYIEMIASYGMPVGAEVFETCLWIGRFMEQYESAGKPCYKVYRKDVKSFLCGNPRAKDSNITTAIVDLFDPLREYGQHAKGTKARPGPFYGFSKDVWAAMAVALTATSENGIVV